VAVGNGCWIRELVAFCLCGGGAVGRCHVAVWRGEVSGEKDRPSKFGKGFVLEEVIESSVIEE